MISRFLVLVGQRAGEIAGRHSAAIHTNLPQRCQAGGLQLFTPVDAPVIPLPAIDGWVIGRLFSRDGSMPVDMIPSHHQLAIGSTRGAHLLAHWSGSYAAFWQERSGRSVSVLRDPSATQAVYRIDGAGWRGFASDVELLQKCSLLVPRSNPSAVAHFLRFPLLPSSATCLDGVTEVLPGERLDDDDGQISRTQLWSPFSFCRQPTTIRASERDRMSLAAAIDQVVAGWTHRFAPLLLELSGGLDSSVIAAALAKAASPWTNVTIATESSDGDERAYARLVADATGSRLTELHLDHGDADPLSEPTRLMPRPGGLGIQRGFDRLVVAHLDDSDAKAIISGTGGDNVFCLLASSAPVLDAWQAGGSKLALNVAGAVAALTGTTIPDVFSHAARRWISMRYRRRRWLPEDLFLSRDARPAPHAHPWLDLPRETPHGSWAHIAGILRVHPVLEAHDRASDRQMLFPLLTQPVLEACLAIPSWQWIDGGRDRAVVRDAYAGRLPASVLSRRRKGHLTTTFARAYELNRARLRELLCGGLLAEAGLLDRNALEVFLSLPVATASPDWYRIIELADAELWARLVRDRGTGCAASD